MKYGFKVIRDTKMGYITPSEIYEIPDGIKIYSSQIKSKYGLVEANFIYDNRQKAEENHIYFSHAAEISRYDEDSKKEQSTTLIQSCKCCQISQKTIADILEVSRATVRAYARGVLTMDARQIAKLDIFLRTFNKTLSKFRNILPKDCGLGQPNMSRGGNPELYKKSPNYKK
jgi:hypothetical protein